MSDGRGPVAVALLFFVGACVAAFTIGTPSRSLRGEAAAQTFLTTWRQSRMATFVVDSDYTRTLPDGNKLQQTVRVVQQPPDNRLIIGLGSVAGRLGGKILRCASTPGGSSNCITAEAAPDYTTDVDREIAGLEVYLRGDRPLYRVIDFADSVDHCFRLDLAVAIPSPPYGDHALFCFDRSNFAPSLTVIERVEATDRTQAKVIRTTVAADDLHATADPGALVGVPGQTTSTTTPASSGG
ncbi:MAG: hypothetical protein QOI95_3411 [Acidimicrobiaceae bacterium]|jgi:hypothetical protein